MDAGACGKTAGGDEEDEVVDAGACDEAKRCNEEDVAVDAGACDEAVGGDEEGIAVDADACDEAEGCNEEEVMEAASTSLPACRGSRAPGACARQGYVSELAIEDQHTCILH